MKNKTFVRELKSFLWLCLLALAIRTFIFEPYFVPTSSMVTTVLPNDYIFATKYNYGFSKYSIPFTPNIFSGRILDFAAPKRGDVVVFYLPNTKQKRFIKRLIGLPGDTVQIKNKMVYINGKPVHKEYIGKYTDSDGLNFLKYKEVLPNGIEYDILELDLSEDFYVPYHMTHDTEIFKVPQGFYFCMGDNRDRSNDSRGDLSFIPHESLIGKAQFVYFSTDSLLFQTNKSFLENIKGLYTWISSIRVERLCKSLVPKYTKHD